MLDFVKNLYLLHTVDVTVLIIVVISINFVLGNYILTADINVGFCNLYLLLMKEMDRY